MRLLRSIYTKQTQAYAGKSLRNLAVICVSIGLVGLTFFRESTDINSIAALMILAVTFWLPGLVLTDTSSRTETE